MDKLGEHLSSAVRPVIALMFAGVACAAFLIGRLNADQWLGLATMVIAFYFATKSMEVATKRAPNRSTDVNIEGNVQNVRGGK